MVDCLLRKTDLPRVKILKNDEYEKDFGFGFNASSGGCRFSKCPARVDAAQQDECQARFDNDEGNASRFHNDEKNAYNAARLNDDEENARNARRLDDDERQTGHVAGFCNYEKNAPARDGHDESQDVARWRIWYETPVYPRLLRVGRTEDESVVQE